MTKKLPEMKKAVHKKISPVTVSNALFSAMKILKKKKLPSVSLDAEVLLAYVLKKDRMFILAHPEYLLKTSEIRGYNLYIRNRLRHMPVAYITGQRDFYGNSFFINKNVLIPRPETELLIEEVILYFRQHPEKKSLLDVGTGSGCIALSLTQQIPSLQKIVATDISQEALSVAKKNARALKLESRVTFKKTNLLNTLKESFDCIMANLPYLSEKEYVRAKKICPEIKYEPKSAICAGKTGLELFELFFQKVSRHLNIGGIIFLEIGSVQQEGIQKLVKKYLPKSQVRFVRDLSKRIRVAVVESL